MTDIDFEELDKAVNSLMNQQSSTAKDSAEPKSDSSPNNSTPRQATSDRVSDGVDKQSLSSGERNEAVQTRQQRPAVTQSARPSVMPRSGGRFMDVVTSSPSNQRGSVTSSAPSERAKREAPALQPTTPTFDADQPAPIDDVVKPAEPDYFDEASFEVASVEDFNARENLDLAETSSLEQSPLESPFLEGVAVNKRPLGWSPEEPATEQEPSVPEIDVETTQPDMPDPLDFQPEYSDLEQTGEPTEVNGVDMSNQAEPSEDASFSANDPWASETEVDQAESATVLRPELSPEVIAVESSEPMIDSKAAETGMPVGPHGTLAPARPLVAGDIAQQYTAETTDDPEPQGIFEAAAESPQPLKHTEDRKSGWMIVVWIVLLIILGAAGGMAAWWFLLR